MITAMRRIHWTDVRRAGHTPTMIALLLAAAPLAVNAAPASPVRAWVQIHQTAILRELLDLLALPNVATDTPGIESNARAVAAALERRGLHPELLRVEGAPPLVVADVTVPGARRTVSFYAHYDGQP